MVDVTYWHKADSLKGLASRPLLGIKRTLPVPRVRERRSGGAAEVEHTHMLFHLPHPYKTGRKHDQTMQALERLIDRHGEPTTSTAPSS